MPFRLLAALVAPALLLVLIACRAPSDAPEAHAAQRPTAAYAVAQDSTAATEMGSSGEAAPESQDRDGFRLCMANIFNVRGRDVDDLRAALDLTQAYGATAVRHAVSGQGFRGGGLAAAETVADALRARGMEGVLTVNGTTREEVALPYDEVREGGKVWGSFLREYADVYPGGVGLLNETNLRLRDYYRVLRRRNVPRAAIEDSLRARAVHFREVIRAFAEGVDETCAECKVTLAGLGGDEFKRGGEGPLALMMMRAVAPLIREGLVAPVLDIHNYPANRDFAEQSGRVTLTDDFAGARARLLREAGWPADAEQRATETNLDPRTFRDEAAMAPALAALIDALAAVPNMTYVCGFSPFVGEHRWYAIPSPDTRLGAVWRAAAERHQDS